MVWKNFKKNYYSHANFVLGRNSTTYAKGRILAKRSIPRQNLRVTARTQAQSNSKFKKTIKASLLLNPYGRVARTLKSSDHKPARLTAALIEKKQPAVTSTMGQNYLYKTQSPKQNSRKLRARISAVRKMRRKSQIWQKGQLPSKELSGRWTFHQLVQSKRGRGYLAAAKCLFNVRYYPPQTYPQFRSRWTQKFVNTLILDGRQRTVDNLIVAVLRRTKVITGLSPVVTFFYAIEQARTPVWAYRMTQRRVPQSFTKVMPWWKQYMLVFFWLKEIVKTRTQKVSAKTKLFCELLLVFRDQPSALRRKRASTHSIAIEARLQGNFRWK